MDTEQLFEFYILSQTLSFSKAADILYISQSTLSRHMKELESELGVTLLLRSTHQVTLSEAGQHLALHIQPLLKKCNHAENMLHIKNLSTAGEIHIACELEISYASHIMVFINRFTERYQDINLTLDILTTNTPPSVLNSYDFIFTPCEYYGLPNNLSSILLHSHNIYLSMPPGHRLITKQSIQFSDLVGETIIVPYMNEAYGPYRKNYELAEKYTHGRILSLIAPNINTSLFWVAMGKGVCMIPRYCKNFSPGEIFLTEISNPDCCFNEYVYFNHTTENNAAMLFYEELCTTFPHNEYEKNV